MKFLSSLLPAVALAVSALLTFASNGDPATLIGGQGHIEPQPKKYRCQRFCEDADRCLASAACALSGNVCKAIVWSFSGQCVAGTVLEECTTQPANDDCAKEYSNPCTRENPTCTTFIGGCGTKYTCN
jgi:hypothetical protein